MVKADDGNGGFYEVNPNNNSCSCGGYRENKLCSHSALVHDINFNRGRKNRFAILSALHKECRRNDLRLGLQWARIYDQIAGPGASAKYLSKALFEESRALTLFSQIRQGKLAPDEVVRKIILSRKKWTLDYLQPNHFESWLRGFQAFKREPRHWDIQTLKTRILKFDDIIAGYETLFRVKMQKKLKPHFWQAISERAQQEHNSRLLEFLSLEPTSGYCRMIALELTLGLFRDDEANDLHCDPGVQEEFIPAFQDYVWDVHHWKGVHLLRRHWTNLVADMLPDDAELNIAWSGLTMGVYNRFQTYRQKGSMRTPDGKDWAWNRIQRDPIVWKQIPEFESYWYPRFFKSLERKGLWISRVS
ncbi:hypothetical protein WDW86_10255 [Bdellovibrionota bacterium FG-2]